VENLRKGTNEEGIYQNYLSKDKEASKNRKGLRKKTINCFLSMSAGSHTSPRP
jgi:hypothetical protein